MQLVATKRGMLAALSLAAHKPSEQLYAYSFERLTAAIGLVVRRAAADHQVRADITPEDLLRAVFGLCYSYEGPDWQKTVGRLIDVFVDGLTTRR